MAHGRWSIVPARNEVRSGRLLKFHERSALMARVRVGLVGCGFVAELHMYAYRRVHGVEAQVSAVAARGERVLDFASKHGIGNTYRDFQSLLRDRDIDVIDICTPPALHAG